MTAPTLLALLLLTPAQAADPAQADPRLAAAHKDGQRCAEAVLKEDYELLADLTHPRILENLGGRERMLDIVRRGMKDMKAQGFTFESCKADPPERLAKGEDGLYAVIPTTLVVGLPEGKLTNRSFLVGFSKDDGKTWVYIDGANGGPAVRELFPEIPKDLALPERQEPKYEVK
jgi:hypothetical protein